MIRSIRGTYHSGSLLVRITFQTQTHRVARLHRIYGFHRISLAKLAAHGDGWKSMTYQCRGSMVTREYKSFLANRRTLPSGGLSAPVLLNPVSRADVFVGTLVPRGRPYAVEGFVGIGTTGERH